MLTIPTNLVPLLAKTGYKSDWILKIAGASGTTYYASKDFQIEQTGEGPTLNVKGLIKDWGDIKQKVTPVTGKTSVSNLNLTLNNSLYRVDPTDGWTRISDELTYDEIVNRTATVYLYVEGVTSLNDCLIIYSGRIKPSKGIDATNFNIDLVEASQFKHRDLPQTIIDAVNYPLASEESLGRRRPITYGSFTYTDHERGSLAEGIRTEPNRIEFDHILDACSKVFIYDEDLKQLSEIDSGDYTLTLDDSGITSIVFDDINDLTADTYFWPSAFEYENTSPDKPGYPFRDVADGNTYDKNSLSHCHIVRAARGPDPFSYALTGTMFWYFSAVPEGGPAIQLWLEINYNYHDGSGVVNTIQLDMNGVTIDIVFSGDNAYKAASLGTGTAIWESIGPGALFDEASITIDTIPTTDFQSGPDDNAETETAEIREVRLRIQYTPNISGKTKFYVECDGRAYGTWVGGARSHPGSNGDPILNPAGIIEDILRSELGFSGADIDTDAFDVVATNLGSDWDMSFQIIDPDDSRKIIEDICFQCKIFLYIDSVGRASISRYDDTSSDDSLTLDDINDYDFKLSQGDDKYLTNSVEVGYNKFTHRADFQDVAAASNATSISDHNATYYKYIKASKILDQTAAESLRDFFSGASGHWKDLRPQITVKTPRYHKVDWEIGDIITPAVDIDSLVNFNGSSWGSATFIVIDKKIAKDNGLEFKMIESN